MPRPANPGWRPKTVTLSSEVIEAVWVKAFREGKAPGRVINEILVAALLPTPAEPERSAMQSPVPPEQCGGGTSVSPPSSHREPAPADGAHATSVQGDPPGASPVQIPSIERADTESPAAVGDQPEPLVLEQADLIKILKEPNRYGLGSRAAVFQELTERCGEKVSVYEFHRWQEQASIPTHLLPYLQALTAENGNLNRFKKT